jgi:NADPH:quinone reductase-like Zn-dependent oxidoreductase
MKAVVYRSFGGPEVLELDEIAAPEPGQGELLVRNYATTVSAAEAAARRGKGAARLYFGPFRPRFPVLGASFAGQVVALGPGVTRFSLGDLVFGAVGPRFGALAEFVTMAEDGAIAVKPPSLSFGQAAAVFDGSLTALPFLRDAASLRPGQHILINGASGAVGAAAVQLAKHLGAVVTAVCSGANQQLVARLGADQVIDYEREDFTRARDHYDVIFDAIGKSSFAKSRRSLKSTGRYLTTVPSLAILVQTLVTSRSRGRRGAIALTGLRPTADVARDLQFMSGLAGAGGYTPVVDRTYPLEQTAEAHRYVDTERKRGSVVITIGKPE